MSEVARLVISVDADLGDARRKLEQFRSEQQQRLVLGGGGGGGGSGPSAVAPGAALGPGNGAAGQREALEQIAADRGPLGEVARGLLGNGQAGNGAAGQDVPAALANIRPLAGNGTAYVEQYALAGATSLSLSHSNPAPGPTTIGDQRRGFEVDAEGTGQRAMRMELSAASYESDRRAREQRLQQQQYDQLQRAAEAEDRLQSRMVSRMVNGGLRAELAEAGTPQARRDILSRELEGSTPGSEQHSNLRVQIASVDRQILLARERELRAAQAAAEQMERDAQSAAGRQTAAVSQGMARTVGINRLTEGMPAPERAAVIAEATARAERGLATSLTQGVADVIGERQDAASAAEAGRRLNGRIARATDGLTGSDLAYVQNRAAQRATLFGEDIGPAFDAARGEFDRDTRAFEGERADEDRDAARAWGRARTLRRSILSADLAEAPNAEARRGLIRARMGELGEDDPEYHQLRGQLAGIGDDEGPRGRRLLGRISLIGASIFAFREVSNLGRAINRMSDDQAAFRYGGSEEQLDVARQQAASDPFDSMRRAAGYLSPILGQNLGGRLARWSQDSDLDRVAQAQQALQVDRARTAATIEGRTSRASVAIERAQAATSYERNPFEQQLSEARDELGAGSLKRVTELHNLDERINTPGLSPAEMAPLMVQRRQRERDQVGESRADQGRYEAQTARVNYERDVNTLQQAGRTYAMAARNNGLNEFQAERVAEMGRYAAAQYQQAPGSREFQQNAEESYERDRDIDRRESNYARLTSMSLESRRSRLDAGLARSRAGEDLSGIVGQTREEVEQFRQAGETGFAEQSRQLGIEQLNLYRQNYLDNLQGRQASSQFEVDPQNRGGEDPVTVLKRIETAIKDLGGG